MSGFFFPRASAEPRPGLVVGGKYRLESKLGEGGFAWVFAARHTEIRGLQYAVKLLKPEATDHPSALEEFRREAETVARLRSRFSVNVMDYGTEDDGTPYLVMELIEGPTLSQVLNVTLLDETQTAHVTAGILIAIREAHGLRIIHRDLKPSNVLIHVTEDDPVPNSKVVDFGIAQVLSDDSQDDPSEEGIVCTPRYVAPEVLLGRPGPGSDLYAVGLMMTEMLAGVSPYEGATDMNDYFRLHIAKEPVPLPEDVRDSRLGQVISRACEKDPLDRWRSADAMLAALRSVMEDLPTPRSYLVGELDRSWRIDVPDSSMPTSREIEIPDTFEDEAASVALSVEPPGEPTVQLGDLARSRAVSRAEIAVAHTLDVPWPETSSEYTMAVAPLDPETPLSPRLVQTEYERTVREKGSTGPLTSEVRERRKALRARLAGSFEPVVEHRTAVRVPADRDAFVGRESELTSLQELFEGDARLVTLAGAAGTGKTRLARQFARQSATSWPGGVWFCDLADAHDGVGIATAVANMLEVPLDPQLPVIRLGPALAGRGRALLVLDNVEHILAPAGEAVTAWTDAAPDLAMLVTSREVLRQPGEHVFTLDALSLASAVELFGVRAAAQRRGFTVTDTERPDVEAIVDALDRLPLAIELAAARSRVMNPAKLRQRLGSLDQALGSALRSTFEWTWDLLEEWEGAALAQLSVFEGPFSVEAAERVIDLSPWPEAPFELDVLFSLVDKSLVRSVMPDVPPTIGAPEPFLALYSSIRQYANEKLDDPLSFEGAGFDGRYAAEARHGEHYAELGLPRALRKLTGPDGPELLLGLTTELSNLLAAAGRATTRDDSHVAGGAALAAWAVLDRRGPYPTAVELLENARAIATDRGVELATAHAEALVALGDHQQAEEVLLEALDAAQARRKPALQVLHANIMLRTGRLDEAKKQVGEALAGARQNRDRTAEGGALMALAGCCFFTGLLDEAEKSVDAALSRYRSVGDRRLAAQAQLRLGSIALARGRYAVARRWSEEARDALGALGDRTEEAAAQSNLAVAALFQGDLEVAETAARESLEGFVHLGSKVGEATVLGNLGAVLVAAFQFDEAREVLQKAADMLVSFGHKPAHANALSYLAMVDLAEGQLRDAERHANEAIEIAAGIPREEAFARATLARVLVAKGEATQALAEARSAADSRASREVLAYAETSVAEASLAAGDNDAADSALQRARRIADELGAGPQSIVGANIDRLSRR